MELFNDILKENKAEAKMEEEFLRLLNFGVCSPSLSKFFQNTLYDTPILSNLYDNINKIVNKINDLINDSVVSCIQRI